MVKSHNEKETLDNSLNNKEYSLPINNLVNPGHYFYDEDDDNRPVQYLDEYQIVSVFPTRTCDMNIMLIRCPTSNRTFVSHSYAQIFKLQNWKPSIEIIDSLVKYHLYDAVYAHYLGFQTIDNSIPLPATIENSNKISDYDWVNSNRPFSGYRQAIYKINSITANQNKAYVIGASQNDPSYCRSDVKVFFKYSNGVSWSSEILLAEFTP